MADIAQTNLNQVLEHRLSETRTGTGGHPAWLRLMRYCAELGHGEIEELRTDRNNSEAVT